MNLLQLPYRWFLLARFRPGKLPLNRLMDLKKGVQENFNFDLTRSYTRQPFRKADTHFASPLGVCDGVLRGTIVTVGFL